MKTIVFAAAIVLAAGSSIALAASPSQTCRSFSNKTACQDGVHCWNDWMKGFIDGQVASSEVMRRTRNYCGKEYHSHSKRKDCILGVKRAMVIDDYPY